MSINQIFSILNESQSFNEIKNEIISSLKDSNRIKRKLNVGGLSGSLHSFLTASLLSLNTPILLITSTNIEAEKYRDDLISILGENSISYIPDWDVLLYEERSPHRDISALRIESLYKISNLKSQISNNITIISAKSLLQKVVPPDIFNNCIIELKLNSEIDIEELSSKLIYLGYKRIGVVEDLSDFSVRGGIVDIFSFGSENPIRVEFEGNTIVSIREFDVLSQKSIKTIDSTTILPTKEFPLTSKNIQDGLSHIRERFKGSNFLYTKLRDKFENSVYHQGYEWYAPFFYNNLSTIFDYFSNNTLLILDEKENIKNKLNQYWNETEYIYQQEKEKGKIVAELKEFYTHPNELLKRFDDYTTLAMSELKSQADIKIDSRSCDAINGDMKILNRVFSELLENGYQIHLLCDNEGQKERFEEQFSVINEQLSVIGNQSVDQSPMTDYRLPITNYPTSELPPIHADLKSAITISVGSLQNGFIYPPSKLAVFTDYEIFGHYRRRRRYKKFKGGKPLLNYLSLVQGDYIVHNIHGIGVYQGIETIDIDGRKVDCLNLLYSGGDKIYVPTDQMKMLQKYSGKDGATPTLNKLGTNTWERTKSRVKKAVRDMAQELIELYATRQQIKGFAFSPDTEWQRELEASFIYEETPDQLKACDEIKKDMETPKPMDRLLCGDVGYGKTEVALRAAFKAVMDTKQVAILVPTTILAEQHYYTFKERLKGYPVVVEMLSRFRSTKEQKNIIKKLEDGEVDIIIGTHRLLSKDIKFKDLGLLIVDEEHRFGVAHKERIKQMRKMVDVLTMTATPIPRTLHMALIGTRDMSIIDTPPEGRLPIQTEVVEFNNDIIADAILREIDRGGQVFFVHNRVQSIDAMANFIKELVPQVRVATAHGQMPPAKLEKIMYDFVHNKYDVLVSTAIIESGLDIPKVNTMIINRADRFGLAQLYQLRGRIGRSTRRAYAYLLIPSGRVLSQEAHKRLKAMEEYTDLGSGLRIAMRDLEIRGAGDILGAEQHGHMLSVGFDLYCQILRDAIREIKGEEEEKKIETTVKAYFDSYIPDTYIAEQGEKIIVYRKLSNIDDIYEIGKLKDELTDRFGKLPKPVLNLFEIVVIKLLSSKIGLEQITIKEKFALLEYPSDANVNLKDIENRLKDYSKKIEFQTGSKIALKIRFPFENTVEEQTELIKKILSLL